ARFVEMFGDPVLNDKSWQVIKLGELCSKICSGNTPKGGSDNYKKEGIMFFRSQNVWKNRLELDDIVYIDEATHERMKETSLNYGDILITKTGRINTENSSLGRSALFLGKNDSANINGHVYLVRINSELVNRNFVLQILISPQYRDLIRRVCVGGIDKRQLNQNHIYDFPIIVPPLELQNQFASFVEEIDKSRSRIQKSLEASQELFDSLMQEYFG
ncbi:restriction endonuclease subunit S, partial [Catenibacterium mitsuokai]